MAKKKNMFQEKEPTVFLFGSFVTTIHLVLPFIQVLSRLGTVKLHTEDKSFLVLSPEYEKVIERGNITIAIRDEPVVFEDTDNIIDPNFRYNVFVVQEEIPDIPIDMFFFQHPVTYFKNRIPLSRRQVPIFSVYDLKQYPPDIRKHIAQDVYVNETQVSLNAFPAFERLIYQYTDVRKFDGAMPEQVITVLHSLFSTFTKFSRSDIIKIFKEEHFYGSYSE
jgi:hypothetical protein